MVAQATSRATHSTHRTAASFATKTLNVGKNTSDAKMAMLTTITTVARRCVTIATHVISETQPNSNLSILTSMANLLLLHLHQHWDSCDQWHNITASPHPTNLRNHNA